MFQVKKELKMNNKIRVIGSPKNNSRKVTYFGYMILACLFIWFLYSIKPLPVIQCSDGYFLWAPRLSYAVGEILKGHLPFWNPFQFCGTTLLADANTNILNPGLIFYVFLDPLWAYTISILLLFLLLIFGTWQYLRVSGFSITASIIGTVSYSFGGQILFWGLYHGMNLVFSLFPWVLFSFRKYEKTKQVRWEFLSFILTLIIILGGFVQFALIAAVSIIIEGFNNFSIEDIKEVIKKRVVIVALAVLSASIILIPIIEAGKFSHRPFVSYFTGLLPKQKISLLLMVLFGYSGGTHDYPNYFYYIGLVLIAIASLGIRKHFKQVFRRPFLIYSFIFPFILLAVYLNILPGNFQLGVQSDPFRGMFIFIFTLSILSAMGTEEFINILNNSNRPIFLPFELFAAFFVIVSMIIMVFKYQINKYLIYSSMVYLGLLFVVGFIVSFIFIGKKSQLKVTFFSIWLVALVILNCFPASNHYLSTNVLHTRKNVIDECRYLKMPVSILTGEGRVMYIGPKNHPYYYFDDWAIYNNIRAIGGYGSFFPRAIFIRMRDEKLFTMPYNAATHFQNNCIIDTNVLAKYGIAYLIVKRNFDVDFSIYGWDPVINLHTHNIYRNPKFVGRAYIIDKNKNIVRGAKIIKEASSFVKILIEGKAGEMLILSDSWFPGWKCYDNGKKVRGFEADGFRGYNLEKAGKHEIEWIYKPKSFFYGGIISLLGFSLFIGWLFRVKHDVVKVSARG